MTKSESKCRDEDKEPLRSAEAPRAVMPIPELTLEAMRAVVARVAEVAWPAQRRAFILKTFGEMLERSGNDVDAIRAYEYALEAHPGIGVKQRLRGLRSRRAENAR